MAKVSAPAKIAAQNRKARHDYFIEDTVEAGIMLVGTEVKSLRGGKASIGEAFAGEEGGELYLFNAYIPEYDAASRFNHKPRRPRKLLVRKREMDRLLGQIRREGVTVVPLTFYFNPRGIVKVELGLARGKRKVDKRAAEKEKDWKRDKARLMRNKG
ncbi:MAG TPA: SsrA-binding protein SmpB [Alphaproteobacteria bacterium]|nr:SsrA-binding protein SmpB [Alphaproteobacteria bacterium]